jgi:hypothetical protein
MLNNTLRAGTVGAGAASRYDSGSDQMMRLLAAPALQHWFIQFLILIILICSSWLGHISLSLGGVRLRNSTLDRNGKRC